MSGSRCRAHGWHFRKQLAGLQQTRSSGSAVSGKVKTEFHSTARGLLLHGERPRRPKADFTTRPLLFSRDPASLFCFLAPGAPPPLISPIPWSDPAPLRSAPRPGRNSWGLSLSDNYASRAERRKTCWKAGVSHVAFVSDEVPDSVQVLNLSHTSSRVSHRKTGSSRYSVNVFQATVPNL